MAPENNYSITQYNTPSAKELGAAVPYCTLVLIVIFDDPSKFAFPDTAPEIAMFLAVASFVAVAELPVHANADVAAPPADEEPAYLCV